MAPTTLRQSADPCPMVASACTMRTYSIFTDGSASARRSWSRGKPVAVQPNFVGPERADLHWGAERDDAGRVAYRSHIPIDVMLLARELDMVTAGKHMPLPLPKPNICPS